MDTLDTWAPLEKFFEEKGLVRQHLDSYNDFIKERLQQVIDDAGKIELDIEGLDVRLGRIRVEEPRVREADGSKPKIYPNEARMRNLTYSARLFLEMALEVQGKAGEMEEVYIGDLPVMLRSNICRLNGLSKEECTEKGEDPLDPGGYFIVNGTERVLVAQEDLASNRILVERGKRGSTEVAKVFSSRQGFRALAVVERKSDALIHVSIPAVPGRIPFTVFMRALGLESDQEIVNAVSDDPDITKEFIENLQEEIDIKTQDEALDYIGRKVAKGQAKDYRLNRAEVVMNRYLLPHIGNDKESWVDKAYYLGRMAERTIELALGRRDVDDKDHYANKRLKLAGDLLENVFRLAFRRVVRDIKYQIERAHSRNREPKLRTVTRADVLTERIRHALATGNWPGGRTGVSQLLDRENYMGTLSHLRRVVSPLSRMRPHFEARDLHPTHWGRICPSETPEGPNCGLVKNLAIPAVISTDQEEDEIESILRENGVKKIEKGAELEGKATVYLNGRLLGFVEDGRELAERIRNERRTAKLDWEINLAFHEDINEVMVNSDSGRVLRPLIIVENGKPRLSDEHIERLKSDELTWSDLIELGIIEYLDTEEEENAYVAVKPNEITSGHTHMEFDPITILGISASLVPYAEHNQSPRNTYGANMAKQALGLATSNFQSRVDTRSHFLHYPQTSIVKTKVMDAVDYNKRPSCQNFVVAIMSYGGYNMEDALIMNEDSINRGLGRSTFYRLYEAEEGRYPGGQLDRLEIPDEEIRGYSDEELYRNLGEDGLAEPGSEVRGKDVLIGKTSPPRFLEETDEFGITMGNVRRENSERVRPNEEGIVDMVLLTQNIDGNQFARVRVRDPRVPEIGDKFASRHGQKGVIGTVVKGADMPFTEDGVVPDLILNPHAIPSRMTVGQLLEMMAGKAGSMAGRQMDGSPLGGESEEKLHEMLRQFGFKETGREIMYDGTTGEILSADIFVGICHYRKLHHMVRDKIHARARGPNQMLARQPTEGRAREGGLRFGEMERDCLIGHGAARVLKDRMLDSSDEYVALVCEDCGNFAVYDRRRDRTYCPVCGDKSNISKVKTAYAFKLLLDELRSMCMAPRLRLGEKA
ncbi:DNA-directed RNA polymerase subunit B [candidate division MSBL1 archaeon SCGC-AAA261F19]|uniref:DNA-directed RNA polymerase subunit beta n=1 Tax=candidate division MSBL1 archaeon SCGC-AAA261F19 TaxID=1698275 RepID=A0A133VAM2_9EURY|nr:DNA-directed RNA polymerase subunit B [candidate division MSBL1 archaeon SCGC-AAA261F19]